VKAKRLTLSNYRGFPQLDITFGDRITVLAGVNGSGKSAILRALASVLSHLLREVAPSKETPESFGATDVHLGKPALTLPERPNTSSGATKRASQFVRPEKALAKKRHYWKKFVISAHFSNRIKTTSRFRPN
jgi:predicted ATP-dependent endonuclease of OLD family